VVGEIKIETTSARPGLLNLWLARLGPFIGLILVIAMFALLTESPARYLSPFNLRIVLAQTVIVALGAIGMTMIIVSRGIDLSVGSVIALSSVVTALMLRAGYPPVTAVFAGVLVGGMVGLVNSLVITWLRVAPFIATLGMLGIARGVAKWIAGQQTVNVPHTWVNELAVTFPTPSWLLLAPGVWVALVLSILTAVVLRNTVFGRRVFALGSNEAAARACGGPALGRWCPRLRHARVVLPRCPCHPRPASTRSSCEPPSGMGKCARASRDDRPNLNRRISWRVGGGFVKVFAKKRCALFSFSCPSDGSPGLAVDVPSESHRLRKTNRGVAQLG